MSKEQMRNQSIADQYAIDLGLARQMYQNWNIQGENQKVWWRSQYQAMVRKHGKRYADHIKDLMRMAKQERLDGQG